MYKQINLSLDDITKGRKLYKQALEENKLNANWFPNHLIIERNGEKLLIEYHLKKHEKFKRINNTDLERVKVVFDFEGYKNDLIKYNYLMRSSNLLIISFNDISIDVSKALQYYVFAPSEIHDDVKYPVTFLGNKPVRLSGELIKKYKSFLFNFLLEIYHVYDEVEKNINSLTEKTAYSYTEADINHRYTKFLEDLYDKHVRN